MYTLDEWVALLGGGPEHPARAEYAKLKEFKSYVHHRLDNMDVPHAVPESEHDKAGCRVGGRLDWVEDALLRLRERDNSRA